MSRSPDAAETFARISDAYKILSDPEQRARYDRGEPVAPVQSPSFYAAHRQQVIAYQRRFDSIVDEIIEQERRESRVRSQVVSVVVTLFLSTFVLALGKPEFFETFNWVSVGLVAALSLAGIWYLVVVLRRALEHYTYRPATPSVTQPTEPPQQPYTRGTALAFLGCGYFTSLAAGALLDSITGNSFSGGIHGPGVVGIFLYPPIAVMIVDSLRRIGEAVEAW